MKIIKLLFVLIVVSALTFSCKSEKKEGAQDESAVEMTEEGSMDESSEAAATSEASSEGSSDAAAAGAAGAAGAAAASGSSAEASATPAEGVEGAAKGVEEMAVAEGVMTEELVDTPAIYPGCVGESREVITACNKTKFIEFIEKEFNKDIANGLGVGPGSVEINSIVQVDTEGKCKAIKVSTSHYKLENEMKRVIAAVPQVTPATHKGESVPITFKLPFVLVVKQDLIEK